MISSHDNQRFYFKENSPDPFEGFTTLASAATGSIFALFRAESEAISRREEGAMPRRIVTDERRRNRPESDLNNVKIEPVTALLSGAVPKWLRGKSAKLLSAGSIPARTFLLQ